MVGDPLEPVPPFSARPGEGKTLMPGITLKASANQTAGSFEVLELQGPLAPSPHVHRGREEVFYILQGQFEFILGEDLIAVGAGSLVFVPRGTRHAPKAGPDARGLVFVAPAGLEGFFQDLGRGIAAGKTQDEMRQALEGKYDSFPSP